MNSNISSQMHQSMSSLCVCVWFDSSLLEWIKLRVNLSSEEERRGWGKAGQEWKRCTDTKRDRRQVQVCPAQILDQRVGGPGCGWSQIQWPFFLYHSTKWRGSECPWNVRSALWWVYGRRPATWPEKSRAKPNARHFRDWFGLNVACPRSTSRSPGVGSNVRKDACVWSISLSFHWESSHFAFASWGEQTSYTASVFVFCVCWRPGRRFSLHNVSRRVTLWPLTLLTLATHFILFSCLLLLPPKPPPLCPASAWTVTSNVNSFDHSLKLL